MTRDEMLAKAGECLAQARKLVLDEGLTETSRPKIDGLMDEARKYKADADMLATIDAEGGAINEVNRIAKEEKAKQEQQQLHPAAFPTPREWLSAVVAAQRKNSPRIDPRLVWFNEERGAGNYASAEKDLSGATGAGGGFLIPEQFLPTLLSKMAEDSIIRPRAMVVPMSSRSVTIPALDQNQSLAAGQPRWFGGMIFYWIGEGQAKPPTDPVFRDIELVAKKIVGFTRASDELLSDNAAGLAAFLTGPKGMAGGVAWNEDYAFFRGNGVGMPLGILQSPGLLTVRREVAGRISYQDVVRMYAHAMLAPGSRWAASQTALEDLMLMTDPEGHYVWGNAVDGNPPRLLGLPVDVTEKLPPHGTTGDLMLNDYSNYVIGDRQATTVDSTPYEAWQYDKTSYRVVHRVDGQPWVNAPFTLQDGVTQISPFVALSSDQS